MTAPTTVLAKEVQFDLGHRVPDHQSKCASPHGHRYRVVATCAGTLVTEPGAPDNGMLVDFGDLKRWLTTIVHDQLDHAFMLREGDPLAAAMEAAVPGCKLVTVPFSPTAENLAHWVAERLAPVVADHWRGNITLRRVDVWETPTSVASVEL